MLNVGRLLLALALTVSAATALAGSRGVIFSEDSAQFFYLSNVNDTVLRNSRQEVSLTIAKEQDPRNVLLRADTEILDYERPVLGTRSLSPKVGLIYGNSDNHAYTALLAGAILRQAPTREHKYDWLAELFIAPHLASQKESRNKWQMDFEWNWGFRVQANYPLPDNAELNLGFRKIMVDFHDHHSSSFDTGVFVGLSYRF